MLRWSSAHTAPVQISSMVSKGPGFHAASPASSGEVAVGSAAPSESVREEPVAAINVKSWPALEPLAKVKVTGDPCKIKQEPVSTDVPPNKTLSELKSTLVQARLKFPLTERFPPTEELPVVEELPLTVKFLLVPLVPIVVLPVMLVVVKLVVPKTSRLVFAVTAPVNVAPERSALPDKSSIENVAAVESYFR